MRVPTTEQTVLPNSSFANSLPVMANPSAWSGIGAGVANAGRQLRGSIGRYADMTRRRADAQDTLAAIEAQTATVDALAAAETKFMTDPDYETAPDRYRAEAEKIQARHREQIKDPIRLARFNANAVQYTRAGQAMLRKRAAGKRTDRARAGLDVTIAQVERTAAAGNPAQRVAALGALRDTIDDLVDEDLISQEEAGARLRGLGRRIAETDVERDARTDLSLAARRLADPDHYAGLPPGRREALRSSVDNAIRVERKRAEAEARARQADVRRETNLAVAVLRDGTAYQGLGKLKAEAERVGDGESLAALQMAEDDLAYSERVVEMSPAELAAEADAQRAKAAAAGSAIEAQRYQQRAEGVARTYDRVLKALNTDPLGWAEAQGNVPETSFGPGQDQNREWGRERFEAAEKGESHYGVRFDLIRPHELAALGAAVENAQSAGAQYDQIAQVVQAYDNPEWKRRVLDQLVDAKIVTPAAAGVIERAGGPDLSHAKPRRLFGELNRPNTEINLATVDEKDVKKKAGEAYQAGKGRALFLAYQATGDAAYRDQYDDEYKATEKIALTRAGADANPGASANADMNGHLDVIANERLAAVWWQRDPAVAPEAVESGLMALREKAAPKLAAAAKKLADKRMAERAKEDPSVLEGYNENAAERARGHSVQSIQQRAIWVPYGAPGTFALVMPGAGVIPDAKGNPYLVTVDDAVKASTAPEATAAERRRIQRHGYR